MREYKTTKVQRKQARSWQRANPFRFWLLSLRARAAKAGRACTVTEDDLRAAWPRDGKCPALGVPLALPGADRGTSRQGPRPDSATVDRIDNSRGYEPGNIAIISWHANRIKSAATASEIQAVAAWLTRKEQLLALF